MKRVFNKLIFFYLLLIVSRVVNGQSFNNGFQVINTQFLDKEKALIRKGETPEYGRSYMKKKSDFYRTTYLIKDSITVEIGRIISVNPDKFQGEVYTYYEDRSIKSIIDYENGIKLGNEQNYYKNGKRKSFFLNLEDKRKALQIWDKNNNALLTAGAGLHVEERNNQSLHTFYKDSIQFKAYVVRHLQKDTLYTQMAKQAEYKGGMDRFYKKIGNRLVYPTEARRNGDQGKVFVKFIVTDDDKIKELEVVKGLTPELNNAALAAVKSCQEWQSGRLAEGQKVNSCMVLPIIFRLTN